MISMSWDLKVLWQYRNQIRLLNNYISFEEITLEKQIELWTNRINTNNEFKTPNIRKQFLYHIHDLKSISLYDLEQQMLALYHPLSTLDSLQFTNDDIPGIRLKMQNSSNSSIKEFYRDLLKLSLLKRLSSDAYGSDYGENSFKSPEIIRSIIDDSTYIGYTRYPSRHFRYTFYINELHFEDKYSPYSYAVPISDTLCITTLLLLNRDTHIDTQINYQQVFINRIMK